MQKRRYTRLTDQERESISRGLAQHKPLRQIAKELSRSPSTIRERFGATEAKQVIEPFQPADVPKPQPRHGSEESGR